MSHLLTLIALICSLGACSRHNTAPRPTQAKTRFVVHSLWLKGQGEDHRQELDRFQQCLLTRSNFTSFWADQVAIEPGTSQVIAPPSGELTLGHESPSWLSPLVAAAQLPTAKPETVPIYVIYGSAAQLGTSACGKCGLGIVQGRKVAVALVRTTPPCWPGQGIVRGLTQFSEHELSCAVELALGQDHCAADGACEGSGKCPDAPNPFTGLYCPGAPERSYTGWDATPVRGWVVQKLSHKGEGTPNCPACGPCDFTVRSRANRTETQQ
ncbi:MAG: hypothetical protein KC502_05410 [Myxococcales bacterium]|nr:hypothetical protein [Myxococcales bacterium]